MTKEASRTSIETGPGGKTSTSRFEPEVTNRPGSEGEATRHEPTTRRCEGCNALTQAAAKESIRRDVELNTMKESHKHADAVMAAKIDRLERKVREGTRRMEEARDASVRYRRERDECRAELDRANKDLDRAWNTCTGLANAPRGPVPQNSSFIEMKDPRKEAREDQERRDRAERDEKIARAQAYQRETAAKAKVEHSRIRDMCLKDPSYLPRDGRTRADYVPAERESSTR